MITSVKGALEKGGRIGKFPVTPSVKVGGSPSGELLDWCWIRSAMPDILSEVD
jgi:hypothetical protein